MSKLIRNWNDLENTVRHLGKSPCRSLHDKLSAGQILDCISVEIEESLMDSGREEEGFLKSIWNKYRYRLFLKQEGWSPAWRFPPMPQSKDEVPFQDAILRLKTAITGFRLHTGSFNKHPLFGRLNKDEWESVHIKVADYFFSFLEIGNIEKSERNSARNFKRKKNFYGRKNKNPNAKEKG